MRAYASLFSVLLCLSSAACSDEASPANTGTGAGGATGGDGGDETGGTSSVCNELELDAPAVGFTLNADPQPTAEGGTIADGKYFLTAEILYETSSGFPTDPIGRRRIDIEGSTWNEVSGPAEPSDENPDSHSTFEMSTTEKTLTLTAECPAGGPERSLEYTATDDEITVFVKDGGKTVGTVFTKQ